MGECWKDVCLNISPGGVYVKIGFTIGVFIIVVRARGRARGRFSCSNDERLFAKGKREGSHFSREWRTTLISDPVPRN